MNQNHNNESSVTYTSSPKIPAIGDYHPAVIFWMAKAKSGQQFVNKVLNTNWVLIETDLALLQSCLVYDIDLNIVRAVKYLIQWAHEK